MRHRTRPLLVREHAEALRLARRLMRADAASAADDRRALLLGSWLGALRAYARWAEHHKHPAA